MMRYVLLFCATVIISTPSYAQTSSRTPLEITADATLEWHRNQLYFKATENVVVVQGATTLHADILTAFYNEAADKDIDMHTIEATGHVRIDTGGSKAFGDKAVYDVKRGYAVMTGDNLRLESDDQTVTARDKFEYWLDKGRLEAQGNAMAVRGGDTLRSSKMVALFSQDKAGKRTLRSLEALGGVTITTEAETLTGVRAVYNAATQIATVYDDVTITRGRNVLTGDRVEVNLKTNVSKILSAKGQGDANTDGVATPPKGRVRGVFYPNSRKTKEE